MKLKCPLLLKSLATLVQENSQSFYPSEPFRISHFTMRHPVIILWVQAPAKEIFFSETWYQLGFFIHTNTLESHVIHLRCQENLKTQKKWGKSGSRPIFVHMHIQGPPTHIETFQTNIFSWFNDSVIQTQWFLGSWDREIWYKTLIFHFINLAWPPQPQKEKIQNF